MLFFYFWKLKRPKNSYISGSNFTSSKKKKKKKNSPLLESFLSFEKRDFLAPSLKDILYFRKEFKKPNNQTKNLHRRNFLSLGMLF